MNTTMAPGAPVTTRRPVVTLVGAGPGDPELLTIKAVKAIQAATVLLVDDLVGDEVLRHARADARIVRVGKRGGCASTPQSFIDRLMVMAARDGERVVRLKGGDPFIFGRGGEEAERLRDQGLEVVVVNGITSGLAAPSLMNVALTHRDHARGVVLVTGHASAGQPDTDWPALGHMATACRFTLVIYMGVANLNQIATGLAVGLSADTPVLAMQDASLVSQRQLVCTLGSLVGAMAAAGLASPCILVVGDVVGVALAEFGAAARMAPALAVMRA